MAFTQSFGFGPDKLGSQPEYTPTTPWTTQTCMGSNYIERPEQPGFNLRTNVPMIQNWGRSLWNTRWLPIQNNAFAAPAAYQQPTNYVPLAYEVSLYPSSVEARRDGAAWINRNTSAV